MLRQAHICLRRHPQTGSGSLLSPKNVRSGRFLYGESPLRVRIPLNKQKAFPLGKAFFGVPGGIRTPDPRLRRPLLYPAELQAHIKLCKNYDSMNLLISQLYQL